MSACELFPPPAALSGKSVELREPDLVTGRKNIPDISHAIACSADPGRRFESRQGMHRALAIDPCGIGGVDRETRRRDRRKFPPVAMGRWPPASPRAGIG